MPINPEKKHLYPADWQEISRRIRFERAAGRCEWCGRQHMSIDVGARGNPIRIILTTAHLDHNPANNEDSNLVALCQRCHLAYDHKHHAENAKRTRLLKQYTAWELCGDSQWTCSHVAQVRGGRATYHNVVASMTQRTVILSRIDSGDDNTHMKLIKRYVHPDTIMVLVPCVAKANVTGV
jgi:hypothetical protein